MLFGAGAAARRLEGAPADSGLVPAEYSLVAGAAEVRRSEFAGGRACAHACLDDLGLPFAPLTIGEGGAPRWPEGVTGSISHCPGFCGAVAARIGGDRRSIGFDAEQRRRARPELAAHILTEAEGAAFASLPPEIRAERLTLVFCAKEAFYKAQYPLTGRFIGFQAASVSVDGPELVTIRLDIDLPGLGPAGSRYPGRYGLTAEHVLCGVTL